MRPASAPPARLTAKNVYRRRRRRAPAGPVAAVSLVAALAALAALLALPAPALASIFSRSSGGGSYRTSSSSPSYRPVSSGYGYKPTYGPGGGGTPSFSAPRPGSAAPFGRAAAAPPSNFGSSFLGGRPGAAAGAGVGAGALGGAAAASAFKPSRPSKATSLAVPLALGAGAGVLASSAFRSGQRSCGDGRTECFGAGCDQARRQCPGAQQYRLRRVRCPSPEFRECWAAGGGELFADGRLDASESPAFLCMGPARPRSAGDVVASCFDYSQGGLAGGNSASVKNGGPAGAANGPLGADDGLTAEQLLSGDPALPSTRAIAASASSAGAPRGGAAGAVAAGGAVAAMLLLAMA